MGKIGNKKAVYLALHRELQELRVIKEVFINKDGRYREYKKEAMLLKTLRHPGIPIIYDLEEADGKLYIIEEYKKGMTLYDRVENIGTMSVKELIDFGISLCQPIQYLHNQKYPIYHLDIQPGNLIIHNHTVSLIDFDHANMHKDRNIFADGYGTTGYAAPEQYVKKEADARTDIYAVGAILYYAGMGKYPTGEFPEMPKSWGDFFSQIIRTCLESKRENRFESMEELLSKLEESKSVYRFDKACIRIAVVSLEKNCGNTYISFGICSYLKEKFVTAIYEESNESRHMHALAEAFKIRYDREGYFYFRGICIRPNYSENINLIRNTASFYIQDYGMNIGRAIKEMPDLIIYVCGGSVFKNGIYMKKMEQIDIKQNYLILFNLSSSKTKYIIPHKIDPKRCIAFPYIEDIFDKADKKTEIYDRIMEVANIECGEENLLSKLKNLIRRFL